MRKHVALLVTLLAAAATSAQEVPQFVQTESEYVVVDVVADSLNHPWSLAFLDDRAVLVTERNGGLVLLRSEDRMWTAGERTTVAGLPAMYQDGQGGLLDLAVVEMLNPNQPDHPDYIRWIYLSYAVEKEPGSTVRIARFTLDHLAASPSVDRFEVIYEAAPAVDSRIHFGARMVVSPGNKLFITLGDRGRMDNAQDRANPWGSIIRLNPDGTIPSDNPFVDDPAVADEIYSFGHRNPQGLYYDLGADQLWAHEHGPQGGDELNLITAGKNYGWPIVTYGVDYDGTQIGIGTEREGLEPPLHYWLPSIAPSGMVRIDNPFFSTWQGDLLVGSLKFGRVHRLRLDEDRVVHEEIMFENAFGRIRDIRQGPHGSVWIITDEENGLLLRLSPLA